MKQFQPFKSPGADGIYPALLQSGLEILTPHILRLYRASLAMGHIPEVWRHINVVFIPKAGRTVYATPKDFRPISLTSFLLKTMEKILDRHIRDTYITKFPMCSYQFAYQAGKSTDTAHFMLTSKIRKALTNKEIALVAILDIEGAFDNTSLEAIKEAAEKHGIDEICCRWIQAMLSSRIIKSSLYDKEAMVKATRGCPQGGVLSPLLWCLVMDELLTQLNEQGIYAQGYADDAAICILGKHQETVSELMQTALKHTEEWCKRKGLRVNPGKTSLIPFTNKRKLEAMVEPMMFGETITFKKETKYLGVIYDSKLTWNAHLSYVTRKAKNTMWTCLRAYSKNWG